MQAVETAGKLYDQPYLKIGRFLARHLISYRFLPAVVVKIKKSIFLDTFKPLTIA